MRQLKQLTPREVLFVGGETRTIHQHTSGLTILDASDRPDFGYESIRKHLVEPHAVDAPVAGQRQHRPEPDLTVPISRSTKERTPPFGRS
jgi:hypothetical protein